MKLKNPSLAIFLSLLLLSFFCSVYAPAFSQETIKSWDIQTTELSALKMSPLFSQWYFEQNQFHAVSIVNGQIMVFDLANNAWNETQRLTLTDCTFTTVQVKDVTGDDQPEIIAGTTDPGFIYIYGQDAANKWSMNGSAKYIWSSVANLMIGRFTPATEKGIIVQDNDGILYFFKNTTQSLNLVWKSPSVWRKIESFFVVDFDNDLSEEIVVTYKAGGIAVLKVQNNAVISTWENYPWGKILAMTYGDWNNDGQSELILTTSQKIVYTLNGAGKGYHLIQDPWQFGYLVENLQMLPGDTPEIMTTDSSGRLHLLEYQADHKKWIETQVFQTGRIAKIIPNPTTSQYLLLEMNRNILFMNRINNL